MTLFEGIKDLLLTVIDGIIWLFKSVDLGGFTVFHFIVVVMIISLVISVFVRTGDV